MESIVSIPKYDAYEDSKTEWLGNLPSHWDAIKMKFLFKDTSIKNKPNETLLSVTQNQGVVPREWVENRMVMPSGNLESFKFIEKGDFAISLRSFEGGLEYCHHDGIISPAYTVLKAKKGYLLAGYYKYLFKSQTFISELQTSIVGIREGKNISYEELQYSFLPIPTEKEQTLIASFLDKKTAQIDEAIAIKEQQISLLKERKQIIIQKAVTQGLDPNVPMKDSGVDWIGKIPEHWESIKLKFITSINSKVLVESTPTNEVIEYVDIGSVSFENGIEKTETYTFKNSPSRARRLADVGDIVVSTVRTYLKAISEVSYRYSNCVYSTGFAILKPLTLLESKFLSVFAKSDAFTTQVALESKGMSYPAINSTDLANLLIFIPPKNEQLEIVDFIENEIVKISKCIELQNQQIKKLKEYKTTLINSAVTGKIKITPEMVEQ